MVTQVESMYKKVEIETDSEAISQKESELKALEALLQEKVAEADNKVEEMISEATKKAQNIEKDARDREAKVIADAYYKQEEIISQAEKEADAIKKAALDEKQSILETIESEVVEVIITLLQHIISEEVTGHVEWLKMVVRRLLLQEEVSEEVTLLVSSNTMALLQEDKDQLIDRLSKLTAIEVDEMLNDTTCVLVTNQGNIEYDINEGLRKVVSELRILKDLT